MTTHKAMREDLDSALHTLTHPGRRKVEEPHEQEHHRARKHFHVHKLHDGTYHVEKDHGEGEMDTTSADDLDGVHDHLEEMLGSPNESEEHEEHGGNYD
jgi:hypothetical protein